METVLGSIEPREVGHFQPHEHIFVRETPAAQGHPALRIDDEARSLVELERYRAAGGGAILDAQPGGAGRDIGVLRRLSQKSGVAIVAVTGYHLPVFYPKEHWIFTLSQEELTQRFEKELLEGITLADGARARVGAVKAAIDENGAEGRLGVCLRAAATAAAHCKAPLILHTEKGRGAVAAVELCEEAGMDPAAIAVCHVDRQADNFHPHEEIAHTGVYLEYDTIARFKYHSDEAEIRLILHMLEMGLEQRLLFSLDTTAARLKSYDAAAPGLDYILTHFLPALREEGVAPKTLARITIQNPVELFNID